ncbi:MAG: hypothetical protein LBI05_11750 [Planctomycetaceae bacterium]|jgi:hypothetical protein|nr:hypothetical protein [Planctomycetaceae bacterium]
MLKMIVGIDPGVNGSLAALVDGRLAIWDLKPCYKTTGTFNSIDPEAFIKFAAEAIPYRYEPEEVAVFIEESLTLHNTAQKTLRSTYDSRGVMRALFYPRGFAVRFVLPCHWQKHFGLKKIKGESPQERKERSVEHACFLFPEQRELFSRPKRGGGVKLLDGRAEAALIASYGAVLAASMF